MVKYFCKRCGKFNTNIKPHYIRHLNRKNTCKPLLENISIDTLINELNEKVYNLNPNESKSSIKIEKKVYNLNPNESKMNPNESKMNPKKCEYCEKIYSTRSNLHKHYSRCKKYKEYKENHFKMKERELQYKEEELNRLTEIINILLKQTKNNNLISNKNKLINNKLINNKNEINTQINNNQKVKINNFGEEDLSYITPEKSKILLIDPRNCITNLIDDTHFNLEHPENANMRIPNKKQPFIELYVDNAWKVFNQYKTICKILQNKKEFIHELFIIQKHE